jgi:WD40-like Beta Propeller Repeat
MKVVITLGLSFVALPAVAVSLQLLSQTDSTFTPPITGGGYSSQPIISTDGRYVLFASTANNLALTTNNLPIQTQIPICLNVYLRDRASNTTALVSLNLAGTGGVDRDALPAGISTNGQFALFESAADNLVAGDTNNASDVFVRDLVNGTTILVSANTNGVGGNGDSFSSVMTPDGRYVVFTSASSNLVASDTNGISDVFVRDLQGGTTRSVSIGAKSTGSTTLVSLSDAPAITPDGRYVAFYSSATNLVPGVAVAGEVYVRDLLAGKTIWASTNARSLFKSLTGKTNVVSCNLSISDDGNYVAFESCTNPPTVSSVHGIVLRYSLTTGLTDLVHTNAYVPLAGYEKIQNVDMTSDGRFIALVANVAGTAGANTAIYLWDAQTGTNILVSANTNNALPTAAFCDSPSISSNGQYVAFLSSASDLTTNVLAGAYHLYLRNMSAGTTSLLDADTNGAGAGVDSTMVPVSSADGQSTAFESIQGNLVMNDYNHDYDVFLFNANTGTIELISIRHPQLPSLTPNGYSTFSAQPVSQNGRYLAFASDADDVVAGDTNQLRDVFERDLFTGTNILVSVGGGGVGGTGMSFDPAISDDGRYVAFTSAATNFFTGDNNNSLDVFVRDLQTQTTFLISTNSTGAGGANKDSYTPAISSDGRFILFVSKASNLAAGSFSGTDNLFLRDRQAGKTYALTTTGWLCAAMTRDGHFIAFTDTAGSTSGKIYLWDAQLASRVATNSTLSGILNVAISPDGNRIAYFAGSGTPSLSVWDRAANLVSAIASGFSGIHAGLKFSANARFLTCALSATANGTNQVQLYDLQNLTSILVSHDASSSTAANGSSDSPDVSADGRFVVYRSAASNIVAGETNGVPDIFLFDSTTGTNIILSPGGFGAVAANNRSLTPVFSGDGHTLVFRSWGSDLATSDYNQSSDLFAFAFLYAAITANNGGGPTISWPASSGQTYNVEYKDDLKDAKWQPVSSSVTIIGNRGCLTDPALSSGYRFYRVVAGN